MKPRSAELGRYAPIEIIASPSDVTFERVYDRLRCEELALCTIARPKNSNTEAAADFTRLCRLDHPSLARVRDFGLTDDAVFYSRELGLPSTLKDRSSEAIDEAAIFLCLTGAAEGMAALHESGLVHGLVLPEHLHVSTAGPVVGVRLADAGLRRLLSPAALRARERYDPPEVRAGAEITPASDIYQLGTTLLAALGRPGKQSVSAKCGRVSGQHLLEFLHQLVAPDARKRFANGKELRRALQGIDWALPERSEDAKSLVTLQMVGREHELGRFSAVLEEASTGKVHAVEFLGLPGMGRSRMLQECGARAEMAGWTAIPISPSTGGEAAIHAAGEEKHAKLLFLVDHADHLDGDVITALRFLVTEAGTRPVLVVSAGERTIGLPGAAHIVLERFGSRDLRRFIEPLLLRALNPEELWQTVEQSAAGNPLWVELLLTSWLESGRLRSVSGRLFFDERVDAEVPQTISETISKLVAGWSSGERSLIEAMAVWGAPLPIDMATKVLAGRVEAPAALVRTDAGSYQFIGDTVGPVVLNLVLPERRQYWNAAFLSAVPANEMTDGQRARLLLGAGKSAEGVRALVDAGREAEERGAYATAFHHLRDALDHYPPEMVADVDRVRLALDAARLATLVGELHWARQVLVPTLVPEGNAALQLERTLLLANVMRELRHAGEAGDLYSEARALIRRNASLQHLSIEVQLDEAANEAARGEGERALRGVEAIVASLEPAGASRLLGLARQRLAMLHAHLGHTRLAAQCELRCARVARRLGDYQLMARACVTLGYLYRLLGRSRRALLALDRAQAALLQCPSDALAASALVNRAEVLIGLGRTEEAEVALLRARALRERSGQRGRLPTILIDLGHLCRHDGRLGAGAAYYREAIALAEEFELPIALAGMSNLGELCLHLGEFEEAERLLRLGLSDRRPSHRGTTRINLGQLRREQQRYPEALQFLVEAEVLLGDSAPHYRPYAVLEMGRVLFAAGDVEGASFQMHRVRDEVAENQELSSEYQLLEGLIAAARGEAPDRAFASALDGVRESSDPTFQAETLITILEHAVRSQEVDESWISGLWRALEEAAARTDARSVAIGVRVIRGAIAERFARPAATEGLAGMVQRKLERGGNAIEAAMGELLQQLPEAAGAAVFVVGVDADGKPIVSPIPKASQVSRAGDGRVRPYRVAVREFDRKLFREALAAAGGNVHEAARQLRLPTSTFRYRASKLGLLKPTQRDS